MNLHALNLHARGGIALGCATGSGLLPEAGVEDGPSPQATGSMRIIVFWASAMVCGPGFP